MKFSLRKSYIERIRFIGLNLEHTDIDKIGAQTSKLYSIIQLLNHLQLVEKKLYFQITDQGTYLGPYVPVVGNIKSSDEFKVYDLIEVECYTSVIIDNDALELGKKSFNHQLETLIKSIRDKISFNFAYISIELNKIELHLFVK